MMSLSERTAVLGVADREVLKRLMAGLLDPRKVCDLLVSEKLPQLLARVEKFAPDIVLLDESLVGKANLAETVSQIEVKVPAIVLASPEKQVELAPLVETGNVDFVARVGEFVPLVAALLARRLERRADRIVALPASSGEWPVDTAEILRHEINNPLTGILGNAELLLSHERRRLSGLAIQRLETIVDLSVRLRETIRRLSAAWESQHNTMRPA